MTKKEQKLFIEDTIQELKDTGTTLGWFLKEVGISRTHWFFIKKGERPLTEEKEKAIQRVIILKTITSN